MMKCEGWSGAIATLSLPVACTPIRIQPVCPSLVPYSKNNQAVLANELRAHHGLKEIPRYFSNCMGLRNQVRACEKHQ